MITSKRGQMLSFLPEKINIEHTTNNKRITQLSNEKYKSGDILYIASRELRYDDNWAINYAKKIVKNGKTLVFIGKINVTNAQKNFYEFGLNYFKNELLKNNIEIVEEIPENISAIITDFNPIYQRFKTNLPHYEIDSHNIIPTKFVSKKREFAAATFRPKIYKNISEFLTKFENINFNSIAKLTLNDFILSKLDKYSELKNDATKDFTSNLSPYMHFGFLSPQRVALEILASKSDNISKEIFLEELIVRRELSDNFCYFTRNFMSYIPSWAKTSLSAHKNDLRNYIYTVNDFEHAKTHDEIWNYAQNNLVYTGKIHGYLRMYWAKKILEWSKDYKCALKTALYLNNKYALDGNDPNSYVGILWSIGGLHDRPFQDFFVTGKV